MPEQDSDDNFDQAVGAIPGAQYIAAVTEIWSRALTDYATAYSRGWSRVQAGNFGPSDLAKGLAQTVRNQFQVMQDLLGVPFRGYEAPQWRYFHFDKSEPNVLQERVQLSAPQGVTVTLKSTPLHSFGPSNKSIEGCLVADWIDGRRDIEVRFDPDKLKGNPPGLYLGFIYDGSAASGQPLLFVLLTIA
jgi:hypothetical protein